MYKNIIIILVLICLLVYLCYPIKFEYFASTTSSSKSVSEEVYEIGMDVDTEEPVFSYDNRTYRLSKNDEFEPYQPKQVKYSVSVKIPSVITSKSIKSKVPLTFDGHKFKGVVSNTFYKQYYILYEKEYQNYERQERLYKYLLVKNVEGTFKVLYEIPPRPKVEMGDTMYFSYGNFQLGPLKFV